MTKLRLDKKQFVDPNTHLTLSRKTIHDPVKVHLHDYYELELILSGSGQQNLNGTVYELAPGSVYFLTPIDFHSVTPGTALEIATLAFDELLLTPQLRQLFMNRRDNFIFQADSRVTQTLRNLLGLLVEETGREDEYGESCRRNLLELFLYTIARGKGEGFSGDSLQTSEQVQHSLRYLFRHFRENITLEDVARRSGYSPNYFSALFHETTGEKFVDFLGKIRINYAKMLLLSTDLSVTQIAERSGFGSASGFFRKFRQATGMAPREFRSGNK